MLCVPTGGLPRTLLETSEVDQLSECIVRLRVVKCITALASKVRSVEGKALASSSCDDDSAASSIRQALSRGSTSVPNRLKPKLLVVEIKQMPSLEAAGARVLTKLPLSKQYDVCLHELLQTCELTR